MRTGETIAVTVASLLLALGGCDGSSGAPGAADASGDGAVHDAPGADAPDGDASESRDGDAPEGPLRAGYGKRSLGFPIGAATVGYSPGSGPATPWAQSYPGTRSRQTALTAEALVLRRGEGTVALVRTDTVGIWQAMVRDAKARLRELDRPGLAEGLVVGATHTHSSGGRVFDHPFGEIAVGPFLAGFYERVRGAIVQAVLDADEAAEPARIGYDTTEVPALHEDRRCENADVMDHTTGLVRVETEAGEPIVHLVNYAVHATVLGNDEPVLSRDASGAIEHGIEAELPERTPVMMLQSWAGDVAPTHPEDAVVRQGHDLRASYRELEAMAATAGDRLADAFGEIDTRGDVTLDVRTYPFEVTSQLVNGDGPFTENYPHGGIYCMPEQDQCGPDAQPFDPDELSCFGFDEQQTITWTWISAVRIGDLGLVTLPGEPLTTVGTALRERALEASGLDEVFVVGYAQGYLGYLLHPDDYFMGGYEGRSALMGPHFGDYLVEAGEAIATRLRDPSHELPHPTAPPGQDEARQVSPLEVAPSEGTPEMIAQPGGEEPDGEAEPVRAVTWIGGNPAEDFPVVRLERRGDDGSWSPVRYPSGKPFTSRSLRIELTVEPDPPYGTDAEARTYRWTAKLPTQPSVPPAGGDLEGTLRFAVEGTRGDGYALTSEPFEL